MMDQRRQRSHAKQIDRSTLASEAAGRSARFSLLQYCHSVPSEKHGALLTDEEETMTPSHVDEKFPHSLYAWTEKHRP